MKNRITYDLDLEKFTQGQNFWNISIKENLAKYAWILCTGYNLFLARSKVKAKVEQNVKFTWLAITLDLIVTEILNLVHVSVYEKLYQIWPWPWTVRPRSKFWKHQLRKTSHNMLGYYVHGIIYCWRGQRSKSRSSRQLNSFGNFASNCHRDFKLRSYFNLWKAAPNMTWTLIFDLDKLAKGQNFWNNNYGKLAKTCWDIMHTA